MILVHFQGKVFSITLIQIYGPTTNAEETEVEPYYEDLENLLELTPKKKKKMKSFLSFHITVLSFYHRGLQLQSRKSRATYNNSQAWPWITK